MTSNFPRELEEKRKKVSQECKKYQNCSKHDIYGPQDYHRQSVIEQALQYT